MKKATVIYLTMIICYSLSAQPLNSKKGLPIEVSPLALIWSDDFSNPLTWTIYTPVGSGPGMDWVIGTAGPAGTFAIPGILSTTETNGYALFDSDFNCSYDQIADIITASPIDCSAYPYVKLTFEQQYRRFRDSTFVFVSNDGFTWTKYPVNEFVGVDFGSSVNPEVIQVDISPTAGGESTVWIKFEFYSPASLGFGSGCNYAWMIDDVSISELSQNEVVIDQAHADFAYSGAGSYTQIPKSEIVPVSFSAAVSNQGALTQTSVQLNVQVANGSGIVFNQNSSVLSSLPYQTTATLSIATAFNPPTIVDNYSAIYTVTQAETELPIDTLNNRSTRNFAVTDTIYARDNGVQTGTVTPNSYTGGEYDDAKIGLKYEFPVAATATSISAYLDSTSGIGTFVQAKIFEITAGGAYIEKASSGIYASAVSAWMTIPLPLTSLAAGKAYLATIVTSGVATGPDLFVVLGADNTTHQPAGVCHMYFPGTGNWVAGYEVLPMIRLNILDPFAGVTETLNSGGIVYQNIPNPAYANTTITYELKSGAEVILNVYDIAGRLVFTNNMGNESAGKHSVTINTEVLGSGIYYYSLMIDKFANRGLKMVVIE